MKIVIGTTSDLKIRSLKEALVRFGVQAEVVSLKTDSKVSSQPFGYDEMILGAKNRVRQCQEEINPDIAIAVESGLVEIQGNYFDIACVYALSKTGEESISFSSGFFTPPWIVDEIKEKNTEYGFITQRISGDPDKDPQKYFSGGVIKRDELIFQAIILALTKLFNDKRYLKE